MRRFLIPIIAFAVSSWIIWLFLLNFSSPLDNQQIAFFLTALFFAITFTLALILYLFYRFVGNCLEERATLRRSLRQSFFVALGLVTLAVLQLTQTLNLLTFILAVTIIITLEFSFRATYSAKK